MFRHMVATGQPQDCCSEEQGWFWSEPSTFWEDWHVSLESLLHCFTHCWRRTLLAMTPSDPDSFTGICWSHGGAHTGNTENWLFQTGGASRWNQCCSETGSTRRMRSLLLLFSKEDG